MREACVLDASVVARWWFTEADFVLAKPARTFLHAYVHGELEIHAPELIHAEVANVLWKIVRFRQWPAVAARDAVSHLLELNLSIHSMSGVLENALDLSLDYDITVYDAAYVSLARKLGVPVYTADKKLVKKLSANMPQVMPLEPVR